jgi:hypothetical protein
MLSSLPWVLPLLCLQAMLCVLCLGSMYWVGPWWVSQPAMHLGVV